MSCTSCQGKRVSEIVSHLRENGHTDLVESMMDAIKTPKGFSPNTPDQEDKNNYLDPEEKQRFMDEYSIDDVDMDPGDLYGVPTLDQVRAIADDDDDLAEALKALGL